MKSLSTLTLIILASCQLPISNPEEPGCPGYCYMVRACFASDWDSECVDTCNEIVQESEISVEVKSMNCISSSKTCDEAKSCL